ncbi:hypothetical protein [Filimonas effusa]|uniref:DNA-binding protein n=1 Tax=Filimonas effusa TaxID=2508721 RepID=A0A4Q1D5P4_9BACT|nr:hypothetical protein [Filimonas effusa]RXK82947.1 hypothetical protein ESB13_12525 [Filimonas effusa]
MLKTAISILCLTLGTGYSYGQDTIPPADASRYLGREVVVKGRIYGGKFLDKAQNSPTFLNMGAAYPLQPLTLVIWGNVRKSFSFQPEVYFQNKMVYVTGTVDTYKEKPQIVITAVSQIKEIK